MSAPMKKLLMINQTVILTLLVRFNTISCEIYEKEYRKLYSTKTAYDDSFTDHEKASRDLVWSQRFPGCVPIQVHMVIRHGTRYPSRRDIENANDLMERIEGKITDPEYKHINEWTVPIGVDKARALAPRGEEELYNIGQRVLNGMPHLFDDVKDNFLLFQSSNRERSIQSGKAFQRGFLQNRTLNIDIRDDLMRYYDNCPKHIHEVEENIDASYEFHKFKRGPEIQNVADRIAKKLNIQDGLSYSKCNILLSANHTRGLQGIKGNTVTKTKRRNILAHVLKCPFLCCTWDRYPYNSTLPTDSSNDSESNCMFSKV